jgi:hypothetical protein
MKRSRGRPKGKKFPQPQTTAEAFAIAIYGKLGTTEAMGILLDCPWPLIAAGKSCSRVDRMLVSSVPKLAADAWARRIGPIIAKKIALGDGEFFRQLGSAVEEFSKTEDRVESRRRYLAIECKLSCDNAGLSFTRKRLRDYYNRNNPGDKIDSSTLSKLFRWSKLT